MIKRFPRIQALSKRDGFPRGRFQEAGKFTSRALASEVTKLGICLVSTNQHATTLALIAQSLKTFFMGTFEWRENSETIQ